MIIHVRDFFGEILLRGSLDVWGVIEAARRVGLPFLAHVDEYDDTVFNLIQMQVVERELESLIERGECVAQAEEILAALETVRARPHRYLVFYGS